MADQRLYTFYQIGTEHLYMLRMIGDIVGKKIQKLFQNGIIFRLVDAGQNHLAIRLKGEADFVALAEM